MPYNSAVKIFDPGESRADLEMFAVGMWNAHVDNMGSLVRWRIVQICSITALSLRMGNHLTLINGEGGLGPLVCVAGQ